jgi:drug/metabolite transporter (DMT)-like permease
MMAIIEGILVAIIWASSFVFIKLGLEYIGPFTLAGLRYFIAALVLLPWLVRQRVEIIALPRTMWLRLALLGLLAYTIANSAFNIGLRTLPATMMSLLMSFNPLLVFVAAMIWLKEIPSRRQIIGLAVALIGSVLFFWGGLKAEEISGLAIALVGIVAFSAFGVLGREVARDGQVNTLLLTALPLAIGGGCLLLVALPIEGKPAMTASVWGLVLWLAVVNTALAYMLYNHALQKMTALEMNVLLNISPLVTAMWAWLLLGERISLIQGIGIVIAIVGISLVQQRPK